MAEPETVCEWLGIELDKLSDDDKMNLIGEIFESLTAQQLRLMRDRADKIRLEKLDEAKAQIISEMRERFEQLDLDFEEELGLNRGRRSKSTLPPKYRSPDGKTWSGRGVPPQWIRDLEEEGGNREDYRIADEPEISGRRRRSK
jgi:DNA-binding protein H-NS